VSCPRMAHLHTSCHLRYNLIVKAPNILPCGASITWFTTTIISSHTNIVSQTQTY
jgi:hypothetical protein